MNLLATRAPALFEPRFRIRRRFLRFGHNFGLVRVEPLDGGGHRVRFAVRRWDERQRRLRTAGTVQGALPL
jgi:hypothetical protein